MEDLGDFMAGFAANRRILCNRCKLEKPFHEFVYSRRDGHTSPCLACKRKFQGGERVRLSKTRLPCVDAFCPSWDFGKGHHRKK